MIDECMSVEYSIKEQDDVFYFQSNLPTKIGNDILVYAPQINILNVFKIFHCW